MTRPVRALLLTDRLDIAGGLERFVCTLANHFAADGMEVAVGSVSTPRSAVRFPLDASVRVLSGFTPSPASAGEGWGEGQGLRKGKFARAWHILATQHRIGRYLTHVIREHKPDVIVLNGLTTTCSTLLYGRLSGHDASRRVICCDHNHFSARSALWQRLRRSLYPRVAAVVSLTEADATKFRTLNPRTQVIYNVSSLHADAPALPRRPLALAVGRHAAQKGFDLLVRAWVSVVQRVPQARLRVIGEGPLRELHEREARELGVDQSIEWLPPTAEIDRHYREAAVFVLSSRYEGMPLALLEAQALGVPAVSFDCPTGPAEIVTPQTGRLVKAGDVAELAAALIELLSSPALRERMAFAAIERSAEVFSPSRHEAQWATLVRDVALRGAYGAAA